MLCGGDWGLCGKQSDAPESARLVNIMIDVCKKNWGGGGEGEGEGEGDGEARGREKKRRTSMGGEGRKRGRVMVRGMWREGER